MLTFEKNILSLHKQINYKKMEDLKQQEKRLNLLLIRTILANDVDNRITTLIIHDKVIEMELDSKKTHFVVIQDADDLIKSIVNLLK